MCPTRVLRHLFTSALVHRIVLPHQRATSPSCVSLVAGSDQQAAAAPLTFRMWSHAFCAGAFKCFGRSRVRPPRSSVSLPPSRLTLLNPGSSVWIDPPPTNFMDSMTSRARFFEPMLCRAVNELPEGPAWSYELKFDGYRGLGLRTERRSRLFSRNGRDFTGRFPTLARALEKLPDETLIDG